MSPQATLITANSERAFELLQNIVQEGGKALLLATHNPVIAEACDWTHEMKDGRITASNRGAPEVRFLKSIKRRGTPQLKIADSWQLAAPPLISRAMENILPILIADGARGFDRIVRRQLTGTFAPHFAAARISQRDRFCHNTRNHRG